MVAKFEKLKLKFSYLNSNMTTNSQTKDVQSRHLFVQFFLKNQCVPERNLNTFVKGFFFNEDGYNYRILFNYFFYFVQRIASSICLR